MKKNEFATFIVYVAMFGLALAIGLSVIRPIIVDYGSALPMPSAVVVIIALIAGVLINATAIELCHVLGAKVGKYRVLKCTVLGLSFSFLNGKKKFAVSSFEGLTGETKVAPTNVEENSLNGYIFFPLLFLVVEFIGCIVGIAICQNLEAKTPSIAWLHISLVTVLTVGAMLFLYDLFPTRLDSVTDGYLLVLLNKPVNRVAYNNLLLAKAAAMEGQPIPETPVYEELTDFTASLNFLAIYRKLAEGKPEEALAILEPILAEEAQVSDSWKDYARTLKLAVLLEGEDKTKGKKYYESFDDVAKKYIAGITNLVALRAYLLIASFIEGSESESNYAIDKAEKAIKACDPDFKNVEKSLLQLDVDLTREAHPSWEVYRLPWEEKPASEE